MNFEAMLAEHLQADYPVLAVSTTEESRVIDSITTSVLNINKRRIAQEEADILAGVDPQDAKRRHYTVVGWSAIKGFYNTGEHKLTKELEAIVGAGTRDPAAALSVIQSFSVESYSTVFIMCDLDSMFATAAVRLRIKDIGEAGLPNSYSHIIIVSPDLNLAQHPRLANVVTALEFGLPTSEELEEVVRSIEEDVNRDLPENKHIVCADETRDRIVQCLRGLTNIEAANVLSRGIIRRREWGEHMLDTIRAEKAQIINQSESLKYIDAETITSQEELGGYDGLLTWLSERKRAYSREARALKIDLPKGICLIGIPGSGKSVAAMSAARVLGLPLFMLDVGSIFGSLVGQSEANLRRALQQVAAQDGCVLMIDEVDKALSNAHTASGDSGTTNRVFGALLSWLSNKSDRTFVIVTMNRTAGLPPEFIRAGRFDAMFYTDLPTEEERKKIIEIHLKKRGVNPAEAGLDAACWAAILKQTEGFVGSELEQVVKNARYSAFDKRTAGVPVIEEWLQAISGVTPLSKLDKAGLQEILEFCKSRAIPVNGSAIATKATAVSPVAAAPRRRQISN